MSQMSISTGGRVSVRLLQEGSEYDPQAGIDIRSKLAMKIYDEYVNVLWGMYSVRFNRGASSQETSTLVHIKLPTCDDEGVFGR